MKRNDIILIIIILIITLGISFFTVILPRLEDPNAPKVVVTINGEEYGTYPLDKDCEEVIELPNGAYNVLKIEDGHAQITDASCPDHICVHHYAIQYSGEMIVCLPNGMIAEIVGGEEDDIDGATN